MQSLGEDDPFDGQNSDFTIPFDNSAEPALLLDRSHVRKPRAPRLTKKDEEPEMSTITVSKQPVISAERVYEYSPLVADVEYEEYYTPVATGPSAVDKVLRKVALYILAAMATLFIVAMCVSLVISDPMILIPFTIVTLAGFSYARMEWQVKRKFRNRRNRR